ncbi:hypothetical protein J2TS4_58410 [Paenibacillus sp. J2TS4]|nr:hypothetical protein J2TS4_58410 [Paenibacillus sp. J2TS4]
MGWLIPTRKTTSVVYCRFQLFKLTQIKFIVAILLYTTYTVYEINNIRYKQFISKNRRRMFAF